MSKRSIAKTAVWGLALWAGLGSAVLAQTASQTLSDPTRPPAELLQGSTLEGDAAPSEPLRVQSVKITKQGKFAVIAGTVVKEGDTYNQMKVVRIHHQGIELQSDSGPVAVSLYPAVTKTDRKPSEKTTNNDSKRRAP